MKTTKIINQGFSMNDSEKQFLKEIHKGKAVDSKQALREMLKAMNSKKASK